MRGSFDCRTTPGASLASGRGDRVRNDEKDEIADSPRAGEQQTVQDNTRFFLNHCNIRKNREGVPLRQIVKTLAARKSPPGFLEDFIQLEQNFLPSHHYFPHQVSMQV